MGAGYKFPTGYVRSIVCCPSRMSYARAASTTADPDRESAISFSMATISHHQNSALEEKDSDCDGEERIPAL